MQQLPYQPNSSGLLNGYGSYQPVQQPVNGVVEVTGYAGAASYPLPPSSSMPLFDSTCDMVYLKTTDAGGYATIRRFRIEELPDQTAENNYVTQEQLSELNAKIDQLLAKGANNG